MFPFFKMEVEAVPTRALVLQVDILLGLLHLHGLLDIFPKEVGTEGLYGQWFWVCW